MLVERGQLNSEAARLGHQDVRSMQALLLALSGMLIPIQMSLHQFTPARLSGGMGWLSLIRSSFKAFSARTHQC